MGPGRIEPLSVVGSVANRPSAPAVCRVLVGGCAAGDHQHDADRGAHVQCRHSRLRPAGEASGRP